MAVDRPGERSEPHALLVLAAGRGSRLDSGTSKWLTPLAKRPLALWQVEALGELFLSFSHRVVVAGYKADAIVAMLEDQRLPFEVVINDRFDTLNNWFSLLLGLEHLTDLGFQGDVVLLNSDLFAPSSALKAIAEVTPGPRTDMTLLVDFERILTPEAMKVCVMDNVVTAIGKEGLNAASGEFLGAARITSAGRNALSSCLRGFLDRPSCANYWYEHAVQQMVTLGASVTAIACPTSKWVEIDDRADMALAEELART